MIHNYSVHCQLCSCSNSLETTIKRLSQSRAGGFGFHTDNSLIRLQFSDCRHFGFTWITLASDEALLSGQKFWIMVRIFSWRVTCTLMEVLVFWCLSEWLIYFEWLLMQLMVTVLLQKEWESSLKGGQLIILALLFGICRYLLFIYYLCYSFCLKMFPQMFLWLFCLWFYLYHPYDW